MKKELGKISSVTFGLGGYQDACIGIHFTFEGEGWGVGYTKSAWDSNIIKWSKNSKWTEEDRSKQYDEIVRYISGLLKDAKVSTVDKLKGIPVEVEFEGFTIKNWRILTEVV